ncbi:hypothetical protein XELAEV_18032391mg [Xenopus laevis]|uniref:Uncharacterized protein n=1 Tax=Xenopus laevis TaxID=8355 RepID=A0A974HGK8_XENLA|nr:hypothetical protein XELAEV_18032391mg [Xenopus laevis]
MIVVPPLLRLRSANQTTFPAPNQATYEPFICAGVSFLDAGEYSWTPANILGDYSWAPATVFALDLSISRGRVFRHILGAEKLGLYSSIYVIPKWNVDRMASLERSIKETPVLQALRLLQFSSRPTRTPNNRTMGRTLLLRVENSTGSSPPLHCHPVRRLLTGRMRVTVWTGPSIIPAEPIIFMLKQVPKK